MTPSDETTVQLAVREIVTLFASGGPAPPAATVRKEGDDEVVRLLKQARADKATVYLTRSTAEPHRSPVDVLLVCRPLSDEQESRLLDIIGSLDGTVQIRRAIRLLEQHLDNNANP